jgi:hypothetical protein
MGDNKLICIFNKIKGSHVGNLTETLIFFSVNSRTVDVTHFLVLPQDPIHMHQRLDQGFQID